MLVNSFLFIYCVYINLIELNIILLLIYAFLDNYCKPKNGGHHEKWVISFL